MLLEVTKIFQKIIKIFLFQIIIFQIIIITKIRFLVGNEILLWVLKYFEKLKELKCYEND